MTENTQTPTNETADSARGDVPRDLADLFKMLGAGPRRTTSDEYLADVRTALLSGDYETKVRAVGDVLASLLDGAPAAMVSEFAIGVLKLASREQDTRVLYMLTDAGRQCFSCCTDQISGIMTRIGIDAVHMLHEHAAREQG